MTGPDHKRRLPGISSRLLAESEAMQQLERQKRKEPISTPEFHRLADEVEHRAREVYKLATREEETGDQIPTGEDSIDDVARGQLP